MQNVPPIQCDPDTLISNFFIAGLTQANLRDGIFKRKQFENLTECMKQTQERCQHVESPEVIFSLYEENMHSESFLKQVFNEEIKLVTNEKKVNPTFFSFMSRNRIDTFQYNHVLIFYERLTESKVHKDFWQAGELFKNFNDKQNQEAFVKLLETGEVSRRQFGLQSIHREAQALQEINNKEMQSQRKQERERRMLTKKRQIETRFKNQMEKHRDIMKSYFSQQSITTKNSKEREGGDSSPKFGDSNSKNNHRNILHQTQEYNHQQHIMDNKMSSALIDNGVSILVPENEIVVIEEFIQDDETLSHQQRPSDLRESMQEEGEWDNTVYFTPIAFVIQTQVEHHSIFKKIMLLLYEHLIKSKMDKTLVYAEFLAHIAFIATLPCPSFNTDYEIEFFGSKISFSEPMYDKIPDKNEDAIKVLFDVLDLRSIIYCWKAILLGKSLVLISQHSSLQFFVQQALLQLIFPVGFTQNCCSCAYKFDRRDCCKDKRIHKIRCGNCQDNDTVRLIKEVTQGTIMTCKSLVRDFDFFERYNSKMDSNENHVAICNIDGSFTNNIQMPKLVQENKMLELLWLEQQCNRSDYDKAFQKTNLEQVNEHEKQFVSNVRRIFLDKLSTFLSFLVTATDPGFKKVDPENTNSPSPAFYDFFNKQEYLENFKDGDREFAEQFIETQLFSHFTESYFHEKVSNMMVFINSSQSSFKEAYNQKFASEEDGDQETKTERSSTLQQDRSPSLQKQSFSTLLDNQQITKMSLKEWPKGERIKFHWRMPIDRQRVILFERLEYSIQQFERERIQREKYHKNDSVERNREADKILEDSRCVTQEKLQKKLQQIKQLYRTELPAYNEQLIRAQKVVTGNIVENTTNMTHSIQNDAQTQKDSNVTKQRNSTEIREESKSMRNSKRLFQAQSSSLKTAKFSSQNAGKLLAADNTTTDEFIEELMSRLTADQLKKFNLRDHLIQARNSISSQNYQSQQQEGDLVNPTEFCYGKNGLIQFLDLLFMQFPSKEHVRQSFNFYFALREQLKMIENKIQIKLSLNYEQNEHLFDMLSRSQILFHASSLFTSSTDQNATLSTLKRVLSNVTSQESADFNNDMAFPADQAQQSQEEYLLEDLGTLEDTGIIDGESQNSAHLNKKSANIAASIDEFIGVRERNFFERNIISPEVWFVPQIQNDMSAAYGLNECEKLVAFRTSYQYLSLKQKLYFAFEDREDAIKLIFGEFLLYPQGEKQIFPYNRFDEILKCMTQPQREIINNQLEEISQSNAQFFQLQAFKRFNENTKLHTFSHTMFQSDFLGERIRREEEAQRQRQQREIKEEQKKRERKTMTELEQQEKERTEKRGLLKRIKNAFGSSGSSQPPQSSDNIQLVKQSASDPMHLQSQMMKEKEETYQFLQQAMLDPCDSIVQTIKKQEESPLKIAVRLLKRLIKHFDEILSQRQKLTSQQIQEKCQLLQEIRQLADKDFGSSTNDIDFNMNSDFVDPIEETKNCFWLNMINFAILSKLLELKLAKSAFLTELNSLTKFHCLLSTITVQIKGVQISAKQIMHHMLKIDIKHFFGGWIGQDHVFPLVEGLEHLAVTQPKLQVFLGIFIPIRKWSNLHIFHPLDFDDQLQKVSENLVQNIQICDTSFLVKIPRQFFFIKKHNQQESMSPTSPLINRYSVVTRASRQISRQASGSVNINMTEFDPIGLLKYYMHQVEVINVNGQIGQQITKLQKQMQSEQMPTIEQPQNSASSHQPASFQRQTTPISDSSQHTQQQNPAIMKVPSAHIFEIDTLEWEFDSDFLAQNLKLALNTEQKREKKEKNQFNNFDGSEEEQYDEEPDQILESSETQSATQQQQRQQDDFDQQDTRRCDAFQGKNDYFF